MASEHFGAAEIGTQPADAVEPMASAMCKSMPDHKVAELILGPPLPSPTPPPRP